MIRPSVVPTSSLFRSLTRLAEGYEAFVPVTTPFGRGFLVWSNSD